MLVVGGVHSFTDISDRRTDLGNTTSTREHYFGFRLMPEDRLSIYHVAEFSKVTHYRYDAENPINSPTLDLNRSNALGIAMVSNYGLGADGTRDSTHSVNGSIQYVQSLGDIDFSGDTEKLVKQIKDLNLGAQTFYSLKGKNDSLRITDKVIEKLATNIAAYKAALGNEEIYTLQNMKYASLDDVKKINGAVKKVSAYSNTVRANAIATAAVAAFRAKQTL